MRIEQEVIFNRISITLQDQQEYALFMNSMDFLVYGGDMSADARIEMSNFAAKIVSAVKDLKLNSKHEVTIK